jgi:hypothetical protein
MAVDFSKLKSIGVTHKKVFSFLGFVSLMLGAALRYPVYWKVPNFYAEDGTVFFKSVDTSGLLSTFEPFNGYPIVGIRLLANLSYYLALYPKFGNLELVAVWTAILSYAFWALLSAFTYVTLKQYADVSIGILGALMVLCTPLNGWNYAILGTIGNLKFAFCYLAFLLMLLRLKTEIWTNTSKFLYLVCVLTNPIAIIFLPFFILTERLYGFKVKGQDFVFAILIGIASIAVFFSARRYPLPTNYKSGDWNFSSLLEVVLGRTFIFPFVADAYQKLSSLTVFLFCVIVSILILSFKNPHKFTILLSFFFSMLVTMILVITRGGISSFYSDFRDPGPAMFFYPQNMMVTTSTLMFLGGTKIFLKLSHNVRYLLCGVLFFVFIVLNIKGIGFNGMGVNGELQTSQGSIKENVTKICQQEGLEQINIPIMPGPPWYLTVSSSKVC